jgi:hypothetical protein
MKRSVLFQVEADNLDFNNGGDINDYENEEDEEYVMQPVAKTVVRGQNVAAASAGSNQQTSSSAAVATKRANVGHIVEIDDSEEDQRRGGSRYLTTEDSGEIETINISKNKKSAEDEDDEDEAPTTKRFRAMKQQMADLNKVSSCGWGEERRMILVSVEINHTATFLIEEK